MNYQAFAWKNALEAKQEIPDPDQHGCGVIGTYKVYCMDNQTDHGEILELVLCDCKKEKFTEQQQCVLLQIPSTNIRKCSSQMS